MIETIQYEYYLCKDDYGCYIEWASNDDLRRIIERQQDKINELIEAVNELLVAERDANKNED